MRRRREPAENLTSFGDVFRVFAPFFRPYLGWLLIGTFALILTTAGNLYIPRIVGDVFDVAAISEKGVDGRLIGLGALAAIVIAIGSFLRTYYVQLVWVRVIADIRAAVFSHLLELSRVFYDRNQSGEIISRLTNDVSIVGIVFTTNISFAVRQFLTLIGALILMFFTSTKLSVVTIVAMPFIVAPVILLSQRLARLSRKIQDRLAAATAIATEALPSMAIVQSYNQEPAMRDSYARENEAWFKIQKQRVLLFASLIAIAIPIAFIAFLALLSIGADEVSSGAMTPGTLVQFIFYAVLVAGSARGLSDIYSELLRGVGAGTRLVELLDETRQITSGDGVLAPIKDAPLLAFENVDFTYPTSSDERQVLRDLDFTLNAGETLALVGPSGAGKSTVMQLILRHYDVSAGRITVSGQDIRDLDLHDLRSHFAYVSQSPAVFAMTAAENIGFARPDATRDEILVAAKLAFADEFITELPDGYDSYVGEDGVLLSGGQNARLALARAFLSTAPILLLDEATAALDAESEQFVQRAIDDLRRSRTVIAIAHRLSTIKSADKILVVDEGRVVAQGTHNELIKSSPLYANLAKIQFIEN